MFYYVSGKLVMLSPAVCAVDCGGVAYKLNISGTTYSALARLSEGEAARLYTYLSVKEDAMDLFGFATEEEQEAFTMLISVSGVGPKAASSILSLVTAQQFAIAVAQNDFKLLSKASGVGPKTAQRIILELKDKIQKQMGDAPAASPVGDTVIGSNASEAVNALCVLGFTRSEASAAVSRASEPGLSLEETVNRALRLLSKQ